MCQLFSTLSTGYVRVSLCLACSKHFLSIQPLIYEKNVFEETIELKYLILPATHHYVQICFTNKTGYSGELSRANTVWTCELTLFLSPDQPPPASSLGRVLFPQVILPTLEEKGVLPVPFLLRQRRCNTACERGCTVQALGGGTTALQGMLQSCDWRSGGDAWRSTSTVTAFSAKRPLSFCHTDSGVNPSGNTPSFS